MNRSDNHTDRSLLLRQLAGVGILLVLVAGFIIAMRLTERHVKDSVIHEAVVIDTAAVDSFLASLQPRYEERQYPLRVRETVPLRMHPFDPNAADSVELLEVGLQPWQARTLIRYRSKGARFRKTEDIKKLFFMNDSLFTALSPYVLIPQPDSAAADTAARKPPFAVREKRDTIIELNTADTASLQLIRGIGRYTAIQIVRYRQQLGGFYDKNQLYEIDNINADSIISHLTVDPSLITPININHASVERLNRHPYISFTQAKCIYELRRTCFTLDLNTFIKEQECLTEEKLQRLLPYLNFDK